MRQLLILLGTAISSATGSSSTQSGTATVTNDGTTAMATGIGALRVSQFSSDPVGAPNFSSNGEWFDIRVSTSNTFTSITVKDANLNGGNAVTWWNPSANGGKGGWEPVSPQSYNAGPPPYVSFTHHVHLIPEPISAHRYSLCCRGCALLSYNKIHHPYRSNASVTCKASVWDARDV